MQIFNNTMRNVLAAAALALTVAVPAHAGGGGTDPNLFTLVSATPGSQGVTFITGSNSSEDVYAGRYNATLGGQNINVFCVDFTHSIGVGDSYEANTTQLLTAQTGTLQANGYYNGGLSSAFNSSDEDPSPAISTAIATNRADEVAYLADNYLNATSATFANGLSGSTNFVNNLSSISIAIWDIIQDGGNGIATGQVEVAPSQQSEFSGMVNYYENQAEANSGYKSSTATWIQAPVCGNGSHLQTYVYDAIPTTTPETSPAIILIIGGIVLMAGIALRRKPVSDTLAA